jgi:HrpA-like helicases
VDGSALEALRARVAFAAAHSAIQEIDADQIRSTLESLCTGLKSFAELRNADILGALRPHGRLLDEIAPEYLPIKGRRVKVNYVRNQPPWLESRLQDFFGMTKTPTVAGGKVPVLLHLLAPNRRPVQMTTDLAGFWVRLYPQLRKELSRRYPKHAWPKIHSHTAGDRSILSRL